MDGRIAIVNTLPYGAAMDKKRLSPDDWIAAGFRALASDGPAALRAEALARALGTTKGSFYWHFSDLAAFKAAMLDLWRTKVATEIIGEVMDQPAGWPRIDTLIDNAARPAPDAYGGRGIESAIRAWALADTDVAEGVAQVDALRVQFLHDLLSQVGHSDPALAQAVYAAYIGLDDLASKGRGDIALALRAMLHHLRPTDPA